MTVKEAITSAVIGVRKFWIIETALVILFVLTCFSWIDNETFLAGFKTVILTGIGGNVLEKALDR